MKSLVFGSFVLFTVVWINPVSAINCYYCMNSGSGSVDCNNSTGTGLGGTTNGTSNVISGMTVSGSVCSVSGGFCVTSTGSSGGTNVVTKSCMPATTGISAGCQTILSMKTCYCNSGDYCTSSAFQLKSTYVLSIIAVTLALMVSFK